MKTYVVFEGVYPFKNFIGTVEVKAINDELPENEAGRALLAAIKQHGGHPVVTPAF